MEENIMSGDLDNINDVKNDNKKSETSMDNIFWDDFWWDLDFWDDIEEIKEKVDKDLYYYLKLVWNILWTINIFIFLVLSFSSAYFYIQNSNSFLRDPILDSFCEYLLPEEVIENWKHCSWVNSLLQDTIDKVSKISDKQFNDIIWILPEIYSLENFIFKKEVQFLLDKSENKLEVDKILNDFDDLLKWFYSVDKWQIKCEWLEISADYTITTKCTVFSADWNWEIMGFDGTTASPSTWGSTISLASSFLNYIEKQSDNFVLLSKIKKFKKEQYTWNWFYTYSTTFDLKLKYLKWTSINF